MTPTDPIPVPRELLVDRELIEQLLATLQQRAIGHTIMYSDRVTPFIPKLRALLSAPPPAVTDKEIVDHLIANAYEHKGRDAPEDVYLSVKRGGEEVRAAVTADILKEREARQNQSPCNGS